MIITIALANLLAGIFVMRLAAYGRLNRGKPGTGGMKIPMPPVPYVAFMKRLGCEDAVEGVTYAVITLLGVSTGAYVVATGGIPNGIAIGMAPFPICAAMLALKKNKRRDCFRKNAYKLYKYVFNQISAGVRPYNALKSMYRVVDDGKLRKILRDACAKYAVSMDEKLFADEIEEKINTGEAGDFASSIRNGLFESGDEKLLERMEKLMFNRYFAYVQRRTDSVRTKCLLAVVMLCVVVVAMVLVPTFLDVENAIESIFS